MSLEICEATVKKVSVDFLFESTPALAGPIYYYTNHQYHLPIPQDYITITRPILSIPSVPSMINPFTTNHDSQFLFRKNYLGLQKSTETFTSSPHSNNLHIQTLQRRNPFTSNSPILPPRNNIFNSPQRPLSSAKNFNNYNSLSQSRLIGIKGGLLEEADGWRRELEKKEKEKMQIYGAQGLRYNAYVGSPRQRIEDSDYYQLGSKKQQSKYPIPNLKSSQHYRNSNNTTDYYLSPSEKQASKNNLKQRREQFQDLLYDQSPNFNIVDPRKSYGNQLSDQSRHSKIKDMFQSQFQDRFKQSMNYNSFYGGFPEETSFKNRMLYNSSKFGDSKVFRRQNSIQSEIRQLEVIAPDSINVAGRIYYRVPI